MPAVPVTTVVAVGETHASLEECGIQVHDDTKERLPNENVYTRLSKSSSA